jgi:prolyl oligopeptidase
VDEAKDFVTDHSFNYPDSRRSDVVDVLHGVPVADPYRWLEEAESPETRAWVEAQNVLTRATLDGPARDALVQRLTKDFNYPRTQGPRRRGARYFFTHNTGLQNQAVLFAQDDRGRPPRVLLDPNTLSADATIALTAWFPSSDGSLVAYALSSGGSDRQTIHIRDTATGVDRPDRIEWVKFASLAWLPDHRGFFYLRFPEPGSVAAEDEQYYGRIYVHLLGDPQERDRLVFERPDEKEVVPSVNVSVDGRFIVVTAQRGASDDSEVHVIDRASGDDRPRPLFTGFDAVYLFIQATGNRLFFRTTKDAPLGRIIAVDMADRVPAEIVPESSDRLSGAVMTRERLVANYLHNASDELRVFSLNGEPAGEIRLPEIGSITSLDAEPDSDEVLFTFVSFTTPPVSYRHSEGRLDQILPPNQPAPRLRQGFVEAEALPPSRNALRWTGRAKAESATHKTSLHESGGFHLQVEDYVTRQVWYPSRDGTRVSMFLVHRKNLERDGDRPVLLNGYGGFNINRTPVYDPALFAWLDRGGVFALANLRGGGEYGEAWHRAGMLERKQNVFDDFTAAAEYLIAEGYTRPARLAIEGGSNGGLLVGAVITQRPDLFGAVICRVPVADMLRYHLFTVGRFWIPEYGSADNPDQFQFLHAYSPYHGVRDAVRYPPTLVMTADTDDRVDPGMAKKFAARLQSAGSGGPYLIRVETKAGHGAGKPVAKLIEEDADILTFLDLVIR